MKNISFKLVFSFLSRLQSLSSARLEAAFFLILYLVGCIFVPSYGIGWDEYGGRAHGTYNVVGIFRFIAPSMIPDAYKNFPTLDEWYAYTHGAWFEILLSVSEVALRLEGLHEIYIMRHFLTFSFCFFGLINFFYLIKRSFSNSSYAFFAILIAISSPRIFADSFYNNKDTVFMSLIVILMNVFSLYMLRGGYHFLILLAFVNGLTSSLRIAGLLFSPFIVFGIFYKAFSGRKSPSLMIFRALKDTFVFLIASMSTLILSMPYLWSKPFPRLIKIIRENRNFDWPGFVRFEGSVYSAKDLPWTYLPKWILITTPPTILILASIGLFILSYSTFTTSVITKYDRTFLLLMRIFSSACIFAISLAAWSNSTLYGGWRHFYFVYPVIVSLAILGMSALAQTRLRVLKVLMFLIIASQILNVASWMVRNHPHQNLYFNSIAGLDPAHNWDFDYWGTANTEVLRWILREDNQKVFTVSANPENPLGQSEKLLSRSELERVVFLRGGLTTKPDYLIENFIGISTPNVNSYIAGYALVKQFKTDDNVFTNIYRRIN